MWVVHQYFSDKVNFSIYQLHFYLAIPQPIVNILLRVHIFNNTKYYKFVY